MALIHPGKFFLFLLLFFFSTTQVFSVTPDLPVPYDRRPDHLWNEIFSLIHVREVQGERLGHDDPDPPLYCGTDYLLSGPTRQRFDELLDRFLNEKGSELIKDPAKRAFFQHDLWAVFDWIYRPCKGRNFTGAYYTLSAAEKLDSDKIQLLRKIATILRAVSLSTKELEALPNNYDSLRTRLGKKALPNGHKNALDNDWLYLGRKGNFLAASHILSTDAHDLFFVALRFPTTKKDVLSYLSKPKPLDDRTPMPDHSQVVLVRRMLLILDDGSLALSPITVSVQIRTFDGTTQVPQFFMLDRKTYFEKPGISLTAVSKDAEIPSFLAIEGQFEPYEPQSKMAKLLAPRSQGSPLPRIKTSATCTMCHQSSPTIPRQLNEIFSFSRPRGFGGTANDEPVTRFDLPENNLNWEEESVVKWKMHDSSYGFLSALWEGK